MNLANLMTAVRALAGAGGVSAFRDRAEAEIQKLEALVPAGPRAVQRLQTAPPGRGVNVIMGSLSLRQKLALLPTLLNTMDAVTRCGLAMRDRLEVTPRAPSEGLLDEIVALGKAHGASSVGFADIPADDIFEGYGVPYRRAVVFTAEMDADRMASAPSFDALREVLGTYGSLGGVAMAITEHLRSRGYGAYPGFPIGGLVDYVRVAQRAGLGQVGYHGMLITPEDGARLRINLVYTNLEAPPAPNPHAWVLDFCDRCRKCVRRCPPSAITTEEPVDPVHGRKRTVHYDACLEHYETHQGCAVCVKVCPFSEAGYARIRAGFERARARRGEPMIELPPDGPG